MSKDDFTKLFKLMSERFDSIDRVLEAKASNDDVKRVLGLLDNLAKR